jgi:hypothetical protein
VVDGGGLENHHSPRVNRFILYVAGASATEQSLHNSLPNTTEQQVLTRATGTKNPRVQPPALAVDRKVAGSNPARATHRDM